jgi:periplasmic protein TonB
MHFFGWPQAATSPREVLWKQTLLISVVLHAALAWIVMQWGDTRAVDLDLQSQVIEVEVVERHVASAADPPVVKSSPVERVSAVHRPVPVMQPQPIAKSVVPPVSQPSARQQAQAPPQPQPTQKLLSSPKLQAPGQQPPAAFRVEPVQTALHPNAQAEAGLAQFQKEQNTRAMEPEAEKSSPPEPGLTDDIRAAYQKQLKELIEREKQYPLLARRGRQQGLVVVEFDISRTGELSSVRVARSSGHSLLDRSALKAVRAVGRFPEPPAMLQENRRYQISISFVLE